MRRALAGEVAERTAAASQSYRLAATAEQVQKIAQQEGRTLLVQVDEHGQPEGEYLFVTFVPRADMCLKPYRMRIKRKTSGEPRLIEGYYWPAEEAGLVGLRLDALPCDLDTGFGGYREEMLTVDPADLEEEMPMAVEVAPDAQALVAEVLSVRKASVRGDDARINAAA